MIRLIASDLDGTLVPEGSGTINPEYYDVILKLKEQGVHFVVASGRGLPSAMKLFTPVVDAVSFMVEEGGLGVFRGRKLYEETIPFDLAEDVIHFVRERWKTLMLESTESRILTDCPDEEFRHRILDGYGMSQEYVPDLAESRVPCMKVAVFWPEDDAAAHAGTLEKEFGDRANILVSGDHWADIVPKHVSKGSGLRHFQQAFGVTRAETVVFGDNINDISMFSEAAVSYSVEEGREETKKAASRLAGSRTRDGVLQVLKTYLRR